MNIHAYPLAFDIVCIDVDYIRPRLACCYLIKRKGKAAFVDCGTSHSTTRLIEVLHSNDLSCDDIEYVIPTHVHLDHAGGAGSLMQQFPNATLIAHPKGARHLIDPQRLVESTKQVYGEEKFNALYGEIIPVDSNRVIAADDNTSFDLNGRELVIVHTPGHARHHFCVYDVMSEGWFTGDTFGLSYPDITSNSKHYLLPTTTPVQFEPDAWHSSIQLLLDKNPQRMYLTHFGMVEDVNTLAKTLANGINDYVDIAHSNQHAQQRIQCLTEKLTEYTLKDLRTRGNKQEKDLLISLLSTDILLNAQGLDVWLTRKEKANKSN